MWPIEDQQKAKKMGNTLTENVTLQLAGDEAEADKIADQQMKKRYASKTKQEFNNGYVRP